MANVMKTNARKLPSPGFGGAVPFGNRISLDYLFATIAAGIMSDSDQASAVVDTDIVFLGILPRGMKLENCLIVISDAFTASTTFDLGFQYVDGTDLDAPNAQDPDYFVSQGASSSIARLKMVTANKPIILQKDAWLTLLADGADHASAGVMDITIMGTNRGVG
jgi:hypothetical protein